MPACFVENTAMHASNANYFVVSFTLHHMLMHIKMYSLSWTEGCLSGNFIQICSEQVSVSSGQIWRRNTVCLSHSHHQIDMAEIELIHNRLACTTRLKNAIEYEKAVTYLGHRLHHAHMVYWKSQAGRFSREAFACNPITAIFPLPHRQWRIRRHFRRNVPWIFWPTAGSVPVCFWLQELKLFFDPAHA